ncbi:hypothetical protein [Wolbachia endosymbiont of Aedes albopictus]|uniref:hypothetical protein n=1 Tax=Wolbachia endosymbiont of Aedes albopictus TaxID=167957 RepID=UPI002167C910|nr:hypothetical protein [Wolbachia endosymbiont of Aedes albopictus]UVW83773.1 hypothetical protein NHG98_05450 [Wolbachia endosymbiont of Aedes albopictus]
MKIKEKASGVVVAEQFLIEVVMDIKELVKVFNLNNYACNTNFTVEGKKIVGLFASGTDTKEYLRRMEKGIIERQYLGGSEGST